MDPSSSPKPVRPGPSKVGVRRMTLQSRTLRPLPSHPRKDEDEKRAFTEEDVQPIKSKNSSDTTESLVKNAAISRPRVSRPLPNPTGAPAQNRLSSSNNLQNYIVVCH